MKKDYFIGIDSDGCVFDSMEVKHKECFCPAFINHMNLQGVSKQAREVWEFVNLYSISRGINRYKALLLTLDLLKNRAELKERNVAINELRGLRQWVDKEPKLGKKTLYDEYRRSNNPDLKIAYEWSKEVDDNVSHIFRNVGLFPNVLKALKKANDLTDIMVISQTPENNIRHEWSENGIISFVEKVLGQESGTKTSQLRNEAKGKYGRNQAIMIGDAPGDMDAAKHNGLLFFPIIPGKEKESWQEFYAEGLDRFYNDTYVGPYEDSRISLFLDALPENPDWETGICKS